MCQCPFGDACEMNRDPRRTVHAIIFDMTHETAYVETLVSLKLSVCLYVCIVSSVAHTVTTVTATCADPPIIKIWKINSITV